MENYNPKPSFKKYFLWMLLIVLLFTFLDGIVHLTVEALEVYSYPIPESLKFISENPLIWYAIGKFFGTIIICSLAFFAIRPIRKLLTKSALLTIIVVALLEVRYYLSGNYYAVWHIYNVILHAVTFFLPAYFIFWKAKVFE